MTGTVSLITTFNRPDFLERTLSQIVALGDQVLVVDDGSEPTIALQNERICKTVRPTAPGDVTYLHLPTNRGLAGSLGVGLEYLLCDTAIDYISYFQDDVEVLPETHRVLRHVYGSLGKEIVLTGHDALEHKETGRRTVDGVECVQKVACRATHMFADRASWGQVLPLRSKGLGFPKRINGQKRGGGSNIDWWICRDAVHPLAVWSVPGLVRTYAWTAEDSLWGNRQRAGEDQPLHRRSIEKWFLQAEKG